MTPISAGKTDTGRKRQGNEDGIGIFDDLGLYVVADGMGGHAAGEVASRIAVEAVRESAKASCVMKVAGQAPGAVAEADAGQRLLDAIDSANREVLRQASSDPKLKGMGTTVAAALFSQEALTLAHVGDSRIYLFRGGELKRLTRDHSMVEDMVAAGQITALQARTHPFRNVVTRALGTRDNVEADISRLVPKQGDVVMLCSDGLTSMLEDAAIEKILDANIGSPFSSAQALVKAANEAGGDDNISVVLLKF
ncbi:MAG: Stp1/IreP family PP2C-type Ser/Thr phosphatase [Nitrospirota bacterium]